MSRDEVYLRHIIDAIEIIAEYVKVGEDRFMVETQPQDAIIRRLEIVGEATKRLSPELRGRYPTTDWRAAAGARDVLIHNYMGVDLDRVWAAATQRAPDLKRQIEEILAEEAEATD